MAAVLEISNEDVLAQEGPEITDMGPLIDRGTTRENRYDIVPDGPEVFCLSVQGIEESKHREFPFLVFLWVNLVLKPETGSFSLKDADSAL